LKRRDVGGRIEKTRFSFAREREREREKEKEKERGGKGASPDAFDAIKEKERGRKRDANGDAERCDHDRKGLPTPSSSSEAV